MNCGSMDRALRRGIPLRGGINDHLSRPYNAFRSHNFQLSFWLGTWESNPAHRPYKSQWIDQTSVPSRIMLSLTLMIIPRPRLYPGSDRARLPFG